MAWAVRASQLGQQKLLVLLLALTLLGGFGFMSIKYAEYKAKWEHGLLWAGQYDPHLESHGDESASHDDDATDTDAKVAADPAPAEAELEAAGEEGFQVERSTQAAAGEAPQGLAPPAETQAEQLEPTPANAQIFFSIYFLMTGLHGVHVLAGMIIIFVLMLKAWKGAYGPAYFTPVDLGGLYWHLVDLIWIFLFPLLYLIH
jgi:cytochrome c oxidase subunit 3